LWVSYIISSSLKGWLAFPVHSRGVPSFFVLDLNFQGYNAVVSSCEKGDLAQDYSFRR
jgi:hypothetical protein